MGNVEPFEKLAKDGSEHEAVTGERSLIGGASAEVTMRPPASAGVATNDLITLSVVIPTLNEAQNILELFGRLDRVLQGIRWEAIVVDDNSLDGTSSIVKEISARDPRIRCIRRFRRRGLSGACIEGVLSSAAPFVAIMDADLQHDETCIPAMLESLTSDSADLVIASRYTGAGAAPGFGRTRGALSRAANLLAQMFLVTEVHDPVSGFFMIRREQFERMVPKLSPVGYKILLDLLISSRGALRIIELPYTFRERFAGDSKFDLQIGLDFIGLLIAKATGDFVGPRFFTFALVGASGLVIHLVVLRMGLSLISLDFSSAQTLATLTAIASNFLINNAVTYRDCRLAGRAFFLGFLKFFAICSVGAFANVGTASWLYSGHFSWWGAGLTGALMGAVWNYSFSAEHVWHTR